MVSFALRLIGKRRLLVPLPFAVAGIQARLFEFLPSPPPTTSQVDLLRVDKLASGDPPGFRGLDIRPQALEDIVPTCILDRDQSRTPELR
jgi:NADH dehydrogenase